MKFTKYWKFDLDRRNRFLVWVWKKKKKLIETWKEKERRRELIINENVIFCDDLRWIRFPSDFSTKANLFFKFLKLYVINISNISWKPREFNLINDLLRYARIFPSDFSDFRLRKISNLECEKLDRS